MDSTIGKSMTLEGLQEAMQELLAGEPTFEFGEGDHMQRVPVSKCVLLASKATLDTWQQGPPVDVALPLGLRLMTSTVVPDGQIWIVTRDLMDKFLPTNVTEAKIGKELLIYPEGHE